MHTLLAHRARLSELAEGAAAPRPPFHSGFNEATLIFVVWVCVPLGINGYVSGVVSWGQGSQGTQTDAS